MDEENNQHVTFRDLWKNFYTGKQLYLVLTLFALSCWGTIDSFRDADGDRILGALPIVMPGVLAIWQLIPIVRKKNLQMSDITGRFYFSGLTMGAIIE